MSQTEIPIICIYFFVAPKPRFVDSKPRFVDSFPLLPNPKQAIDFARISAAHEGMDHFIGVGSSHNVFRPSGMLGYDRENRIK